MKKQLLIISIIVVITGIFVSCSVNRGGDFQLPSTTAVTDEQGTTHYYQSVTESESASVYAEIVTDDKSTAVTEQNGKYVTKEYATIFSTTQETVSTAISATEQNRENPADNEIKFETTTKKNTTTTKGNTTTSTTTKPTEKETTTTPTAKVVTDKDGWINKWY